MRLLVEFEVAGSFRFFATPPAGGAPHSFSTLATRRLRFWCSLSVDASLLASRSRAANLLIAGEWSDCERESPGEKRTLWERGRRLERRRELLNLAERYGLWAAAAVGVMLRGGVEVVVPCERRAEDRLREEDELGA